ncbi:hypothetical protein KPC190_00733 [Klebsiella pneumoniae]|nr:hypothetical protein [Klebsiella pneumoniae]MCB8863358.1 hypothetical protein [Klebsiella pneumoniae]
MPARDTSGILNLAMHEGSIGMLRQHSAPLIILRKSSSLMGAILKVRLLFCCHGSVSSSVRFLAGKMPEVFAGSEWFTWNQEKDLANPPFLPG